MNGPRAGLLKIIIDNLTPLLALVGLGGGLLYAAFSVIVIILGMMEKQQVAHLEMQGKVMDLLLKEVGTEQRRIYTKLDEFAAQGQANSTLIEALVKGMTEIRTLSVATRQKQDNLVPLVTSLVEQLQRRTSFGQPQPFPGATQQPQRPAPLPAGP